jgi:hypothetical protein
MKMPLKQRKAVSEIEKAGRSLYEALTSAEAIQKLVDKEAARDKQEREDAKLARNLQCESMMGLPTERNKGILAAVSPANAPFVTPGFGTHAPASKKPRFDPSMLSAPAASSLTYYDPNMATPSPSCTYDCDEFPPILRGSAANEWFRTRHKDYVNDLDKHHLLLGDQASALQMQISGLLTTSQVAQRASLRDKLVGSYEEYSRKEDAAQDGASKQFYANMKQQIKADLAKLDKKTDNDENKKPQAK